MLAHNNNNFLEFNTSTIHCDNAMVYTSVVEATLTITITIWNSILLQHYKVLLQQCNSLY